MMAININKTFCLFFLLSFYCFCQPDLKNSFNVLLKKCSLRTLPFNSLSYSPKNVFGINDKSSIENKKLFADVFYGGNTKQLISKLKIYNEDEDLVSFKDVFRKQGIAWYVKVGDFFLVEYGAENDTINDNPPGGVDLPSIEYLYLFSKEGKVLDKLPLYGFYSLEDDKIESYINTDFSIDVYKYNPYKDAYEIKKGIYYPKKDSKFFTKVLITKYIIDEKFGKFKEASTNSKLLKSPIIEYKKPQSKLNSDDPMHLLPKVK